MRQIPKKLLKITFVLILFLASCAGNSRESGIIQETITDYQEQLIEQEKTGGELFCDDTSEEGIETFHSCVEFSQLKERGCFGRTTLDMQTELSYISLCQDLAILKQATVATENYFALNTPSWWEELPAETIPMPSGIYEDEKWEEASLAREKLVTDKLLNEINFSNISTGDNSFEARLSSEETECGVIDDYFYMNAVLLADFDGDNVAELWIKGKREYRSESCFLGSGNRLGGSFSVILKKTSSTETPAIFDVLQQ